MVQPEDVAKTLAKTGGGKGMAVHKRKKIRVRK